jgi:hypothetical protein
LKTFLSKKVLPFSGPLATDISTVNPLIAVSDEAKAVAERWLASSNLAAVAKKPDTACGSNRLVGLEGLCEETVL